MIIKPYSAIAQEPFAAADYPALAHFFPFTETSGSTVTDVASGLVVDDASHTTVSVGAEGYLNLGAGKNVISSGTVSSPGAKKVIVISVYRGGAVQLKLGSITANTNYGFQVSSSTAANSTIKVSDGTSAFTSTDGLDGSSSQNQVRVAVIDWQTDGTAGTYGLSLSDYDGTTWTNRAAVSLATSTAGISAIEQSILMGATSNPFCHQVWYFDAVPADYKAAALWVYDNATNTTNQVKAPYPGWKGRT